MTAFKEEMYKLARQAGDRAQSMYASFSGADVAEAEVFSCIRRVYVAIADGGDLEAAIKIEDERWRKYAAEQAAKIAAAPKTKRGPSAGQSVISHRWVSPELFQTNVLHICAMVKIIQERITKGDVDHE